MVEGALAPIGDRDLEPGEAWPPCVAAANVEEAVKGLRAVVDVAVVGREAVVFEATPFLAEAVALSLL